MRVGASTNKEIIQVIPEGKQVTCYGYHTGDWYLVSYNNINGFCSKKYLK
jgi:uncharacterized protein YraI